MVVFQTGTFLNNITHIEYNFLNLPTEILIGGNQINYIYNALGERVSKTVTENSTNTETHYLDGFQYKDNYLQFFPTAEGYVNVLNREENDGGSFQHYFDYVYNYTDHLDYRKKSTAFFEDTDRSSVILSYTDANRDGTIANYIDTSNGYYQVKEILEENNYYPFGLKHKQYNSLVGKYALTSLDTRRPVASFNSETGYKYKYQGQERQDELALNWDSFKWRNYDYALGRFMSVDPLAEDYSYQSPYNFAENRVFDGNELEGLEWEDAEGNPKYEYNLENEDEKVGKYTEYATEEDIKFGEGLRDSGKMGAAKFEQLVMSDIPTTFIFSDVEMGFAGSTDPIEDNGKLVGFHITIFENSSERIIGNHDPMRDGVNSVEAKLIDEGNITPFEYSVSTFGHEIGHATKRNHEISKAEDAGMWNYQEKKYDKETRPTRTGIKIIEEMKN